MSKKVVILEDDEGVRQLLLMLVETEGWQVTYGERFSEVEGALEWADVMILDLQLPQVDGIEVLSAIRSRGLDLPVVVVTGADPEMIERAERYSVYAFISKPFEVHELVETLKAASRGSRTE